MRVPLWLLVTAALLAALLALRLSGRARGEAFGNYRECKNELCGGKGRCPRCKGGKWRTPPAARASSGDCMTRCVAQGGGAEYCNLHCAGRGGDGGGGGGGPGGRCPDGHYYSTYHHYSGGEREGGLACSDQLRGKIPDDPGLWLSADLDKFPCGTWVNLKNPRGGSLRMMAVDMRGREDGKSAFDLSTAGFNRIDADGSGVRDGHMCLRVS